MVWDYAAYGMVLVWAGALMAYLWAIWDQPMHQALHDRFAGTLSTGSPGAILIIEVPARDFSLSQMVRLIEQSDAKVLSVSTQGQEQAPGYGPIPVHVTLKLNTADTARVKHVLDHHGYNVVAAFNEEDTDDAFNQRLAEFLRYLEV
jgi:acetoin utilization protein AcuB